MTLKTSKDFSKKVVNKVLNEVEESPKDIAAKIALGLGVIVFKAVAGSLLLYVSLWLLGLVIPATPLEAVMFIFKYYVAIRLGVYSAELLASVVKILLG